VPPESAEPPATATVHPKATERPAFETPVEPPATATVHPKATERPAFETPVEPPAQPAAPPASPREPGALDAVALRSLWPEVLNVIESGSRTIRALLEGSQVLEASGSTVTLAVRASLAKRLAEERNVSAIAQGLAKVVGGTWQIIVKPDHAGSAPAPDNGAAPASTTVAPPPAPEPDPRDDPDYEPDVPPPSVTVDPEAEAVKLLRQELGARPLSES
jgi:DNA polymerase-3 subunit gamma/tau